MGREVRATFGTLVKWEEVIQPRDAGGPHIRNGFRFQGKSSACGQAVLETRYRRKEIRLSPSMNQKDIIKLTSLFTTRQMELVPDLEESSQKQKWITGAS